MKKYLYIFIAAVSIIFGMAGALISIKLFVVGLVALFIGVLVFIDYQKATYLVSLYIIVDFCVRQFFASPFLGSYWDELLFMGCVALWFYKWLVFRKQKPYSLSPMDLPLVFFFGFGIFLLLVNSPDMIIGIEGFRAVLEYMIWFFVIVQLLKTPKGARNLLYIIILVGGLLSFDGLRQYIFNVPMPKNWVDLSEMSFIRTRVYSIMGNPNALASLMVLLIPPCFSLILFEKNTYKKLIFGLFTLTMTATLVFTFTRAAWIGFVAAIFIFVLLKDKRLLLPALFATAVLGVLVVIFMPSVANRVLYLLSPDYLASSAVGGRIFRWNLGIEKLMENLWLGTGFGRFGGAVAANHGIRDTVYMDNYYLKIAVETGLLGITAFVLLIGSLIVWCLRAIRNLKKSPYVNLVQGIFAGMCGLLIHAFAENVFEVPSVNTYFWIMAGIVMYLGFISKESRLNQ